MNLCENDEYIHDPKTVVVDSGPLRNPEWIAETGEQEIYREAGESYSI